MSAPTDPIIGRFDAIDVDRLSDLAGSLGESDRKAHCRDAVLGILDRSLRLTRWNVNRSMLTDEEIRGLSRVVAVAYAQTREPQGVACSDCGQVGPLSPVATEARGEPIGECCAGRYDDEPALWPVV